MRDEKLILPVSTAMHGEYGVVLSMPCIVGKDGIETKVPITLNQTEEEQQLSSAKVLKDIIISNFDKTPIYERITR